MNSEATERSPSSAARRSKVKSSPSRENRSVSSPWRDIARSSFLIRARRPGLANEVVSNAITRNILALSPPLLPRAAKGSARRMDLTIGIGVACSLDQRAHERVEPAAFILHAANTGCCGGGKVAILVADQHRSFWIDRPGAHQVEDHAGLRLAALA